MGTWEIPLRIFGRSSLLINNKLCWNAFLEQTLCLIIWEHQERQTSANRVKPVLSFQVWKWLCVCHLIMSLWIETAQLKVENSAQTSFRFSPFECQKSDWTLRFTALPHIWHYFETQNLDTYETREIVVSLSQTCQHLTLCWLPGLSLCVVTWPQTLDFPKVKYLANCEFSLNCCLLISNLPMVEVIIITHA